MTVREFRHVRLSPSSEWRKRACAGPVITAHVHATLKSIDMSAVYFTYGYSLFTAVVVYDDGTTSTVRYTFVYFYGTWRLSSRALSLTPPLPFRQLDSRQFGFLFKVGGGGDRFALVRFRRKIIVRHVKRALSRQLSISTRRLPSARMGTHRVKHTCEHTFATI